MKTLALALIAILCSYSVALAQDQASADDSATTDIFNVHYSSQGWTVTIESKGGVVSVVEVPEGVLLNVEGHVAQNLALEQLKADEMPRLFRGDLVIRTRRADEVAEEEGHRADSIIAKAPLELRVRAARVVVERAEEVEEGSLGER